MRVCEEWRLFFGIAIIIGCLMPSPVLGEPGILGFGFGKEDANKKDDAPTPGAAVPPANPKDKDSTKDNTKNLGNPQKSSNSNDDKAAPSPSSSSPEKRSVKNDTASSDDDIGAVLIKTIYSTFPPAAGGQPGQNGKEAPKVPDNEMLRLKAAVKGTGLHEAKADRVVRAVQALDLDYGDVVDLKKVMVNPATTADYADRVRRALEEAFVEKHLKNVEQNKSQTQQNQNQQQDPSSASKDKEADPSVQRLKALAYLSGVDKAGSVRLVRAVTNSGLEPHQVHQIGETIQHHAASPDHIQKMVDHLEETDLQTYRKRRSVESVDDPSKTDDANFQVTPEEAKGADWLYDN